MITEIEVAYHACERVRTYIATSSINGDTVKLKAHLKSNETWDAREPQIIVGLKIALGLNPDAAHRLVHTEPRISLTHMSEHRTKLPLLA